MKSSVQPSSHTEDVRKNVVLTAGMKVKSKLGGPEMLIVGFCETSPPVDAVYHGDKATWKLLNGTYGTTNFFPKLMINYENKTNSELGYSDNKELISHHFIFSHMNDSVPADLYRRRYSVVVTYYSKAKEDFIHKVMNAEELEKL